MIRKVKISDAAAITEIYNRYIVDSTATFEIEPLEIEQMRGRIAALIGSFPYFVWEEEGQLLGYCYAHTWKERPAYSHTWETSIYLDSAARGGGIGRKLMERLIGECRSLGVHALIACITAENEASVAFHHSLGYSTVSHFNQVGFKFGRWLDVEDLELLL